MTEAPITREAISEERVRSIFYASFDISQGDGDLQPKLLARVCAKHPEILAKLLSMNLDKDEVMQGQLQHKVSAAHRKVGGLDTASETASQIASVVEIFDEKSRDELLGDQMMAEIIGKLMVRDTYWAKGRTRMINGNKTIIFKFYLVEYGVLGEKYRGDKVWQEFFDDVHNFLGAYRLSEHDMQLSGFSALAVAEYFTRYNRLIESGKYTNKECKQIDYTDLPIFG